jgi:signal transduction histidine kinase
MPPEDKPPQPEREQTDESLRLEREKADDALSEKLAAIEETADAVISKARERADEVLAAARAETDRQRRRSGDRSSDRIRKERAVEDATLEGERAEADETVRAEREAHVALLSIERGETDKDLVTERARSDKSVGTRDDFLGIVSHDLRNMLGTMTGFAGMIIKAVTQENHAAQVLQHAQRIQRAGARMDRLIGDLVDVASIEAGMLAVTREVADPAHVVTEAVEIFQAQAAARGVTLEAEIVRTPSHAPFDPARILQVVTNLVSNAIKFTPAGRVVAKVERIDDDLRFSVRDTGEGIPEDKLEAVFERFRQVATNDRRGVGLGLYISKCIVQGHGGRIWVESKMGHGSTFFFTIPIERPPRDTGDR